MDLDLESLSQPISTSALDGHVLGTVTHQTKAVCMLIPGNHLGTIQFHVLSSRDLPLILGFPWLCHHNPHINWSAGSILKGSPSCKGVCLKPEAGVQRPVGPCSTADLSQVPAEYHDFHQVFSKARATLLPPHQPYDCAIDLLPGTTPLKGRYSLYSLSTPEREAMDVYINDALVAGIIRPSLSPAGAGFFFVDKKDKTLRPCIDYHGLNDITVKIRYPLPLISPAFKLLQGATIFNKLNLHNTYHLVQICEGDEWKMTFNTPTEHYEYLVMPVGLTNAPAVFQALINDMLRDMLNKFVFVYLDDILIFSCSEQEYVHHVQMVLQCLLENSVFGKADKCEFHAASVSFLGYIICQNHMEMDPEKVGAVASWPVPETRKQLQRFLGFTNFYRRFIRGYSTMATPPTAFTTSKVPFHWIAAAEEAFQHLINHFTSAPIVRVPDTDTMVEVDTSDVGVGAKLCQHSSDDLKMHPFFFFFPRRLSPAERNYDIGNWELLVVKLALEEWQHWLEGTKVQFLVWTDHKNLEYIRTAKGLNSHQARWSLPFTRINSSFFVLPTRFSQCEMRCTTVCSHSPSLPLHSSPDLGCGGKHKSSIGRSARSQHLPPELSLRASRTKVIPITVATWLSVNMSPRTMEVLQHRFWWPSLAEDTTEFVNACPVCSQNKMSRCAPAGHLQPLPIHHQPWPHISMDFVAGLPPSEGKTSILTMVDRFSKMAHFIPLSKLPSAKETAEVIVNHVFHLHGLPVQSLIEAHSSPLYSGRSFVICLVHHPACPLGFTHRQMDRLNR